MASLTGNTSAYFDAIGAAFTGLDAVAKAEAEQTKRNNLIYHALYEHLSHLRHSFECWQNQCRFADSFKLDTEESGFPTYHQVLNLEDSANRREERLLDMDEPDDIREQMIDQLLKYKQFPAQQQKQMAERLFLDQLDAERLYAPFTEPQALRLSMNPRSKRPFYVVHWSVYDGSANLPLIYFAVIEDSSQSAPAVPKEGQSGHRKNAFGQSPFGGLPNFHMHEQFRQFTQNHSAYSLNLTSIATAMDRDFPELHPKQLRRFILGPFYAGGVTRHNQQVQSVLDEVTDPAESWLLTWTMQELYSKEEVPAKHGLWGGTPAKEVFFIDTSDVDCAAQGVSSIERYALIPHNAYQAAYAKGLADEIFKDYQCYIASGEHILQHV